MCRRHVFLTRQDVFSNAEVPQPWANIFGERFRDLARGINDNEFLSKVYHYEIPFRHEYVDILKDIMLTEQTAEYSIYAKTGWAGTTPQVAWYVGFVETGDKTWFFAMNMRVDRTEQAALREELTIRSLRALGII